MKTKVCPLCGRKLGQRYSPGKSCQDRECDTRLLKLTKESIPADVKSPLISYEPKSCGPGRRVIRKGQPMS